MSFFVAVVGLGFLIFVHELGHFGASLALRMRPRRFYIGFPPALWKTERKGIEYGIGAIPLGGFVKIPGMHRPAPADVDSHFARVVSEAPELAGLLSRIREALAEGRMEDARAQLPALGEAIEARKLSPAGAEAARKGFTELEDALGPMPTGGRGRGSGRRDRRRPRGEHRPRSRPADGSLLGRGRKATTSVDSVASGSPAARAGLRPGDRVVAINGEQVGPAEISQTIAASNGRPLTVTVVRDGEIVRLRPVPARRLEDGTYRPRLRPPRRRAVADRR